MGNDTSSTSSLLMIKRKGRPSNAWKCSMCHSLLDDAICALKNALTPVSASSGPTVAATVASSSSNDVESPMWLPDLFSQLKFWFEHSSGKLHQTRPSPHVVT
eukprot:2001713-Pleurochrysis_carterae.AAC.1